jgi:hypothetical protein
VAVCYNDKSETPPDGWEVVPGNVSSNLAYNTSLLVKRRGSSGRPDHITDLVLVYKSVSKIPEGYTAITKTVTGKHDASLNRGTYSSLVLCYTRASNWDAEQAVYNAEPTIAELLVINRSSKSPANNEAHVPANATVLKHDCNRGSMRGHHVNLGYVKAVATGLCDIPYEPVSIDRYPKADYESFEFPTNLPMFIFPKGLPLLRRMRSDAPMPSFFPLVFTGGDGKFIHGAVLTFYEELPPEVVDSLKLRHQRIHAAFAQDLEELRTIERKMRGLDDDAPAAPAPVTTASATGGFTPRHETYGVYTPKSIVIVSQFPFYRALKRFLRQLYRISLSAASAPLERYISYLVTFLPVPRPGGRPFHIHLETPNLNAMHSSSGFSLAPIALALPPHRSLPPMDLDFNAPFRCLSVFNVLNIFSLLLQESQLLFLSARASLVTEVCETFRALLFPLEWSCCYIPRLPDELSGYLDYPGGFVLGMHLQGTAGTRDNAEMKMGDKNSDQRANGFDIDDFLESLNLQDGTNDQGITYVVDLDRGYVSKTGTGKLGGSMFSRHQPYHDLPTTPTAVLKRKLDDELKRVDMVAGRGDGLMDYDSAFEFAPTPDIQEKMKALGVSGDGSMNADVIRDAFLLFMADTMGDFTKNLRPPSHEKEKKNAYHKDPFYATLPYLDVYKVLAVAELNDRTNGGSGRVEFLTKLFPTQMFSYLVQQRTEKSVNDHRLIFFEEAVKVCDKLKAMSEQEKLDWYDSEDESEKEKKGAAKSPAKRLSQIYKKEGGMNLQYLTKGVGGMSERTSENSSGMEGQPMGLVTQLVHEELGNFEMQKNADYQDLDESAGDSIKEEDCEDDITVSTSSSRPQSSKFGNQHDINAMKEDKGSDADNSVNVSRRPPLQIPGPSADGITITLSSSNSSSSNSPEHGGGRRRAQTATAERQWSYPLGWPTPMEDKFFIYPDSALPKILTSMRKQAWDLRDQENRMALTRSADEIHRSNKFEFFVKDPVESAVQIFGAYFVCLPTLIEHYESSVGGEASQREFHKALGCLKRIQRLPTVLEGGSRSPNLQDTALVYTDEAMWRSLLIAAERMSGATARIVSVAIFTMMKNCGISPNPVTYGLIAQSSGAAGQKERALTLVERMEGGESADTFDEYDDAEWEELEKLGGEWKTSNCENLTDRTRGVSAAAPVLVRSNSNSVSSRDPDADLDPPCPPSRQSSFNSLAPTVKEPCFVGGVGMWIKLFCKKCNRTMLEEAYIANVETNDSGMSERFKCNRCHADAERELHWCVLHTKSGEELTPSSSRAPGKEGNAAACAGPAMIFEQPSAAAGSISGIEAIVQVEKSHLELKVQETGGGKVTLMSSNAVRSLLEQKLIVDGEKQFTRSDIRAKNPPLYWNFVWWCQRMSLPLPLRGDGGACKEFVTVGCSENMVRAKMLQEWERRLGAITGGERLVSVEGMEGAETSRRRLASLLDTKDMLSTQTIMKVKEAMIKTVEEGGGSDNGDKYKVLFDGLTDSEVEGLERVKNFLVWGNLEGTPPPERSKWETGGLVAARPGVKTSDVEVSLPPPVPNRRSSWQERLSALSIGGPTHGDDARKEAEVEKERLEKEVAERASRLPIPAKRMHDALEEVGKLRNKGKWRSREGPLMNLYQVFLVICGFFKPEGLSVMDGNFDKLYERGISRINLRQQEWMDQSDTELHSDKSTKAAIDARAVFELLL